VDSGVSLYVTAISGWTGSGKTTLAQASGAVVFSTDRFYRSMSDPLVRKTLGIASWESRDDILFADALAALDDLIGRGTCGVPVYSYDLDRPIGSDEIQLPFAAPRVLVVEGVHAVSLVRELTLPIGTTVDYRLLQESLTTELLRSAMRDRTEGRRGVFRSVCWYLFTLRRRSAYYRSLEKTPE